MHRPRRAVPRWMAPPAGSVRRGEIKGTLFVGSDDIEAEGGMPSSGRSVRMFLVDGSPQGLRTAELGNWSGLALVCPRTDLARLNERPEVRRTGVYILTGPSDENAPRLAAYVGEGDEVWSRLQSHDSKRDFWTQVVIFVSKDDNLTKAHVRWLEANLVKEIDRAKRADLLNGTGPAGGRLPEADTADMETFLDNIRLLLPTLGVNVFGIEEGVSPDRHPESGVILELRWEDARAECRVRDGQFIVTAGSTARVKEVDSLGGTYRTLRKTLHAAGVLVASDQPHLFKFTQDYGFDAPSAAAAVVAGTSVNGRAAWKVKGQGVSYGEWEDRQVGE